MGTRGLYGMRYHDMDKTTYNHFDSYPDGLGRTIVAWLADKSTKELKELFDKIDLVPDGKLTEIDKKWCELHDLTPGDEWYSTLREFQGEPKFLDQYPVMVDSTGFIKDSLFCEYAYIANLDTNELEFWMGFQKFPDGKNRYGTEEENGYYPCKMMRTWSFDDDAWENPETIINEMNAIQDRENAIIEASFAK